MHSHKLIREKDRSQSEWLLEWDEVHFRLETPQGETLLDAPTAQAHRMIEIYELYVEGKVRFETPEGSLIFRSQKDAVADVRRYVEAGLRSDTEYRTHLLQQSRAAIPRGLVMFLIGAVPFGLYCWWASWAPDPPHGYWLRSVGWLIHLVLIVCVGLALGGPFVSFFGFRQLRRIRRIEREILKRA